MNHSILWIPHLSPKLTGSQNSAVPLSPLVSPVEKVASEHIFISVMSYSLLSIALSESNGYCISIKWHSGNVRKTLTTENVFFFVDTMTCKMINYSRSHFSLPWQSQTKRGHRQLLGAPTGSIAKSGHSTWYGASRSPMDGDTNQGRRSGRHGGSRRADLVGCHGPPDTAKKWKKHLRAHYNDQYKVIKPIWSRKTIESAGKTIKSWWEIIGSLQNRK